MKIPINLCGTLIFEMTHGYFFAQLISNISISFRRLMGLKAKKKLSHVSVVRYRVMEDFDKKPILEATFPRIRLMKLKTFEKKIRRKRTELIFIRPDKGLVSEKIASLIKVEDLEIGKIYPIWQIIGMFWVMIVKIFSGENIINPLGRNKWCSEIPLFWLRMIEEYIQVFSIMKKKTNTFTPLDLYNICIDNKELFKIVALKKQGNSIIEIIE